MNMNEKYSRHFQTESEILEEIEVAEAELARQLLSLRQTPSAALQHRIQAIPQPEAAQTRDAAQSPSPQPAQRDWRRILRPLVVGIGAAVILAVALLTVFPRVQTATTQVLVEVRGWRVHGGISPYPTGPEPILGKVAGQRFHGRVVFKVLEDEVRISFGPYAKGTSEEIKWSDLLEPALRALRDPAVPLQRLRPPDSDATTSPSTRGYVVVEVWDDQVNIAATNAELGLRDRAAEHLAQEESRRR